MNARRWTRFAICASFWTRSSPWNASSRRPSRTSTCTCSTCCSSSSCTPCRSCSPQTSSGSRPSPARWSRWRSTASTRSGGAWRTPSRGKNRATTSPRWDGGPTAKTRRSTPTLTTPPPPRRSRGTRTTGTDARARTPGTPWCPGSTARETPPHPTSRRTTTRARRPHRRASAASEKGETRFVFSETSPARTWTTATTTTPRRRSIPACSPRSSRRTGRASSPKFSCSETPSCRRFCRRSSWRSRWDSPRKSSRCARAAPTWWPPPSARPPSTSPATRWFPCRSAFCWCSARTGRTTATTRARPASVSSTAACAT